MDEITAKWLAQIARIEYALKGRKDHALGAKKPSMGQQESNE